MSSHYVGTKQNEKNLESISLFRCVGIIVVTFQRFFFDFLVCVRVCVCVSFIASVGERLVWQEMHSFLYTRRIPYPHMNDCVTGFCFRSHVNVRNKCDDSILRQLEKLVFATESYIEIHCATKGCLGFLSAYRFL